MKVVITSLEVLEWLKEEQSKLSQPINNLWGDSWEDRQDLSCSLSIAMDIVRELQERGR